MAQVAKVKQQVDGRVDVVAVDNCGHAPHREFPELTRETMAAFIKKLAV
jgi:hypothetical protein